MRIPNSTSKKEVDLSNLTEGELEEIMGLSLVELKMLAKDEFVKIVRLAVNRGIELGRRNVLLAYNRSLRERIN